MKSNFEKRQKQHEKCVDRQKGKARPNHQWVQNWNQRSTTTTTTYFLPRPRALVVAFFRLALVRLMYAFPSWNPQERSSRPGTSDDLPAPFLPWCPLVSRRVCSLSEVFSLLELLLDDVSSQHEYRQELHCLVTLLLPEHDNAQKGVANDRCRSLAYFRGVLHGSCFG